MANESKRRDESSQPHYGHPFTNPQEEQEETQQRAEEQELSLKEEETSRERMSESRHLAEVR